MQKLFYLFLFTIIVFTNSFAQNVGIGTTNPHPTAELDVSSTQRGFLPPRMTFAQRAAIVNPAAGLMVWCTDCGSGAGELSVFNGTEWRAGNFSTTSSIGTPQLAPTNLFVTVSSPLLYATLSWTDVSTNETGYKIERKTGSSVFTQIGQVGTNVSTFNDSTIAQSTTYTYRVYAYNSAGNSALYSNEFQITTYAVPTVTTNVISSITNTTATGGGNVTSDGGASVSSRGICWSTSTNPTIALTTKTTDGNGAGTFTSSMTGLTANTTYYVRAYATNSVGTTYGTQQTFTTVNATTLPSVTIGTQVWTSQNLDVARYRNGDIIPQVTDNAQWASLTTGAWCWYDNDSSLNATYGKLYNWYAVNDARGLAPAGWHVPSDGEWSALRTTLVNLSVSEGEAMKSTSGWFQNGNGTNSSGFTGLPGACRFEDGGFISMGLGQVGYWWSSSNPVLVLSVRSLLYSNNNLNVQRFDKRRGFSVRCVRD